MPTVFSCPTIPVARKDIPLQSDVDRWPHLRDIELHNVDTDIDLLIGNDVAKALEPIQVRESQDGGPYALRTLLGWTINGPLGREQAQPHTANRIHSDKLSEGHYEIAMPWRVYPPDLSNNKAVAEQRLNSLKKKLTKDQSLHAKYSAIMKDLELKGYAQKVPDGKKCEDSPAW